MSEPEPSLFTMGDPDDDKAMAEDEDDFEVVGHKSLEEVSSEPNSGKEAGSGMLMGPMETFVMIQREHEALRNELLGQQSLLTAGFDHLQAVQDSRHKEMSDLKEKLAETQAELERQREEKEEWKQKCETLDEYREKVDELTAKLMQAEDVQRYQEEMVRQFKSDGFVNVQPPMLTDALLAKELSDKEEKLKQAEARLVAMEGGLVNEKERGKELEKENEQLRNHVAALQLQLADDRSYVEEIRGELNRLRGGPNNPPRSSPPESRNHSNLELADEVFVCENCALRICSQSLFLKHKEACRPSIDQID